MKMLAMGREKCPNYQPGIYTAANIAVTAEEFQAVYGFYKKLTAATSVGLPSDLADNNSFSRLRSDVAMKTPCT